MDDLREALERGEGSSGNGGWVSGFINWLGTAANATNSTASPLQAVYKWFLRVAPATSSSDDSSSSSLDLDDSDVSRL